MDKHIMISIIATSVIAILVGSSLWNAYALDNLEFRGAEGRFTLFDITNSKKIEVCNPLPIMTKFDQLSIVIVFEGKQKAIYTSDGLWVLPSQITELNGIFNSDSFAEMQYLAFHFDGLFSGTTPMRIDPQKLNVVIEIPSPILGVIPYSVVKQYSGWDFWNMMNEKDTKFNC